jgi:hypothetical protein
MRPRLGTISLPAADPPFRTTVTIHPIRGHASGPHMTGTTWQHRLDAARAVEDVVAAARDFLAVFGPLELAALPEGCRPPAKIVDDEDIASYAFDLVRFERAEGAEVGDMVHRLARFFSHASMRLAQITARDTQDDHGRRSA